jgi:hypothetical protein
LLSLDLNVSSLEIFVLALFFSPAYTWSIDRFCSKQSTPFNFSVKEKPSDGRSSQNWKLSLVLAETLYKPPHVFVSIVKPKNNLISLASLPSITKEKTPKNRASLLLSSVPVLWRRKHLLLFYFVPTGCTLFARKKIKIVAVNQQRTFLLTCTICT